MKVKELLKSFVGVNPEAELDFAVNSVNADVEEFDLCNHTLEEFQSDESELVTETIKMLITKRKEPIDEDNSISMFLDDNQYNNDEINICLNVKKGHIIITDEKGGVLRELVLNKTSDREANYFNVINRLREII